MPSERWRQVEELFLAALEKHPDQRGVFVAEATVSDEVRQEVISLLAQSESGDGPFDRPAWSGALVDVTEPSQIRVAPGTRIGPYRIEDELGAGGMGVVYRAHDTRLNRPVAIKFVSDELASSALRRRFQQEAQMASALNHPHILTVHDAGEAEGCLYLITEFVDGGTLREWFQGNRRWEEIVDLLVGIADGLAAAHRAGILHRDIKPANILVSRSGYAKLADFGLAKLLHGAGENGTPSMHTERKVPGAVSGTLAYMSPEQASAGAVDARSDIFAFGVVLYEALAGRRPFDGADELEILQKLGSQSPPAGLPAHVPSGLRAVVERALEKNPEHRYQSMGEIVADLRRLQRHPDRSSQREISQRLTGRRRIVAMTCSAAGIVVLGGLLLGALWKEEYFWRNPLDGARIERLTDFEGDELDAAISPDGKVVSFLSDQAGLYDAWFSRIGTGEFINVSSGRYPNVVPSPIRKVGFSGDGGRIWFQSFTGPTGAYQGWLAPVVGGDPHSFLTGGMEVAWSPDGTHIVYHTDDPGDPMFVAEPSGRNARRIFVENPGRHCHHPIWSQDGQFIYFLKGLPDNELDIWRVPATTFSSDAERMTRHNARVGYPAWLDDRTLIYSATADNGSGQWLYTLDIERRVPHRVSSGIREQYHSVAVSKSVPRRMVVTLTTPTATLWTVPLSDRSEPEATASPVTLPNARAWGPRFGREGLLFFLSSRDGLDGVWKREGGSTKELWKDSDGGVLAPPSVSPDGNRICFPYRKHGRVHLAVIEPNGTTPRMLAETLEVRSSPSWSPDGSRIVVAATEGERTRLYVVPVDGGSPVRLVDGASYNPLWSPDGQFVVYSEPVRGSDLAVKAVNLDKSPVPLPPITVSYTIATPYRFAPDGKSLILINDTRSNFRSRNFDMVDLKTGQRRQLTDLKRFAINSFDVSPDGKHIIFDRLRDNADIVMFELER